jgi:hypothetical protein
VCTAKVSKKAFPEGALTDDSQGCTPFEKCFEDLSDNTLPLNIKYPSMKRTVILALLTIAILALILAVKAFVWVFATIFEYGILALIIACLLMIAWKVEKWWTGKDK